MESGTFAPRACRGGTSSMLAEEGVPASSVFHDTPEACRERRRT
jgi:hypothetical protein